MGITEPLDWNYAGFTHWAWCFDLECKLLQRSRRGEIYYCNNLYDREIVSVALGGVFLENYKAASYQSFGGCFPDADNSQGLFSFAMSKFKVLGMHTKALSAFSNFDRHSAIYLSEQCRGGTLERRWSGDQCSWRSPQCIFRHIISNHIPTPPGSQEQQIFIIFHQLHHHSSHIIQPRCPPIFSLSISTSPRLDATAGLSPFPS